MKKGEFELAKWSSNQGAIDIISNDDKVTDSVLISNESDNNQKTLGLRWNPSSDNFGFYCYDSIICESTETKRSLTSKVSHIEINKLLSSGDPIEGATYKLNLFFLI